MFFLLLVLTHFFKKFGKFHTLKFNLYELLEWSEYLTY